MYFITAVNPDDTRCVGYFSDLEEAKYNIENNIYDIYEAGCYPNAVIENIPEGIYNYDFHPIWYKYDEATDKYIEINSSPDYITHPTVGFAIG